MEPGNKVEVPHRRDRQKNRQVCQHQSVAKIACDFRWRSNSPRSAYKIARCVAGLRNQSFLDHAVEEQNTCELSKGGTVLKFD